MDGPTGVEPGDGGAPGAGDAGKGAVDATTPAPSFTLAVAPSPVHLAAGYAATCTVEVTRAAGFTDPIDVSVSGAPQGVTIPSVRIGSAETSATLTMTATSGVLAGTRALVVTGQSAARTVTTALALDVVTPVAGGIDTTFGNDGTVSFDAWGGLLFRPVDAQPQANGKLLVLGDLTNAQPGASYATPSIGALRLNGDGSVDATFALAGKLTITPGVQEAAAVSLSVDDAGGFVVSVFDLEPLSSAPNGTWAFARYTADGQVDASFGAAGIAKVAMGRQDWMSAFVRAPDGSFYATGVPRNAPTPPPSTLEIVHVSAAGVLDTSFGSAGVATGTVVGSPGGIAVQADGKVLVSGTLGTDPPYDAYSVFIARFTPAGAVDLSFGKSGLFSYEIGQVHQALPLLVQSTGKILVGAALNFDAFIVRCDAAGVLDSSFGVAGVLKPTFSFWGGATDAFWLEADDALVFGSDDADTQEFTLGRFLADGAPDTTFGQGGTFGTVPQLDSAVLSRRMMDGRIVVVEGPVGVHDPNEPYTITRYWP